MREKILFNDNWKFYRGKPDYDNIVPFVYSIAKTARKLTGPAAVSCPETMVDSLWRDVALPHDYIIEQTPDKSENRSLGYFKYGDAWYRKTFTLPESDRGRRITLLFEGIASQSVVYLNGAPLKRNFSGYNSFEINISDMAIYGDKENVLAVYVDTAEHESWWYEGGGIYRDVWLIKTEDVAIDLWGVYIAPKKQSDDLWSVRIETELINSRYDAADVRVSHTLFDAEGTAVAECSAETVLDLRSNGKTRAELTVSAPKLWDIDSPYLYSVKTTVAAAGEVVDEHTDRTGFRTFYADPEKGFFLNDRHVKIKGVCSHQDFGLTGKAVSDNVHRYKVELIKEMGANGYRTSHYPHPNAVMDALDELGFIVLAETRWFSTAEENLEQLEMLIKRDRNRPSIFFWSLANEEPILKTESGRRTFKNLKAFVQKLDDTRYITTADNNFEMDSVFPELDLVGINYNLFKYDDVHREFPNMPVFASECCATGTTRGWYDASSPERSYVDAYDKDVDRLFKSRERTWKFLTEREWVMGGFQWIAFEHRGETFWPRLCSQSGAIDLFLQKKDAFYQNQSHWIEDRPIVHLLPHWNFRGREGEKIRVVAYTNCEELELYLNGKSLGKQQIEKYGHGEWQVEYEPGTIAVEARSGDKTLCRDEQTTTGRAEKLNLRLDNRVSGANGRDTAVITCYCTDSDGRFVPDAAPFVNFSTNGLGTIVGTGSDISDTTAVSLPSRRMRMGTITVAVIVGKTAGDLKVYASSENQEGTVLTIPLNEVKG